jgi:hypothetical protein
MPWQPCRAVAAAAASASCSLASCSQLDTCAKHFKQIMTNLVLFQSNQRYTLLSNQGNYVDLQMAIFKRIIMVMEFLCFKVLLLAELMSSLSPVSIKPG